MDNVNTQTPQSEVQEDLSLVVKQSKIEIYNKKTKFFCILISAVSLFLCVFFAIAHLIMGTSKFFNLKFSLPAIIEWLDNLPSIFVENPEAMLGRLIIGGIFFILYVIFSVFLIRSIIKAVNKLSYVCDINNTNVDHKVLALECMDLTSKSFKLIFIMSIMGSTTGAGIPLGGVLSIILYAFAFISFNTAKLFYTCYDVSKNEFHANTFTINAIKTISLVIFSLIAFLLALKMPFFDFIQALIRNYNNPTDFTGPAFIREFILPFIKMVYGLCCLSLFILTINIDKRSTLNITTNFFGKVYQVNNFGLMQQKKANKKVKFIIFWVVLSVLAEVLLTCFNTNNDFFIPNGIGTLLAQTLFEYSSIIFITVGISFIFKTNLKIPVPIQPQINR